MGISPDQLVEETLGLAIDMQLWGYKRNDSYIKFWIQRLLGLSSHPCGTHIYDCQWYPDLSPLNKRVAGEVYAHLYS